MEKVVWIVLQGSSRGRQSPLLLFWFYITISGIPAQAADAETACRSPFARVVSIQGSVELLRSGSNQWTKVARLDTSICPGDRVRTGALSRAALFVQPETLVRVDQNTSVIVSQLADETSKTAGETLVEFTQEQVVAVSATAHACGAGYFITRFPRKFKVKTPHLSAAVEGTEFLVANRCEATDLSVIEGKVLASSVDANAFATQSVNAGQTLTVGSGQAPAIKLLIKPADAVQWTLYYPPITPAGTVAPEDCSLVPQDQQGTCLIARAEQFLRSGRVEEAKQSINEALATSPSSSDAKALSSIISLVKNDKAEALRLAKEARDATPSSAPAWLALSYAQQADFKLEAALASAQRAAEIMSSALALARVAELQLSLGWIREAEKTAKQAVAANPSESRAQMILGFVHLAQINVKDAREDFERAIGLDSTEPLSRLGLGLAIIRKGNLAEGREQIEIAVALDPTNSLLRSYVGKAYYEENNKERDQLAATQFSLANQLDPNDPTPWFYGSILKNSQMQPGEALESLRESNARNEDRAVYRSRLYLDEDFSSRGATQAGVYNELGFYQRGLVQAANSLAADPSSYTAHRFLADVYASTPRSEISRASELLQAQLWQPLGAPPLQAQLANDILFKSPFYGPSNVGLNEFNPLFLRDGASMQLFGLAGSHNTYGDQIVLNGLRGPISFAISQFRAISDGMRINNDQQQSQYDGIVQAQLPTRTSVQVEVTSSQEKAGDLSTSFDPNFFFSNLRTSTSAETYRIGIRQQLTPASDVLVSAINQNRRSTFDLLDPNFPFTDTIHQQSWKYETQYLYRGDGFSIVPGFSYFDADISDETNFGNSASRPRHSTVYAYGFLKPSADSQIQAGLSYDSLKSQDAGHQEQANPKLGLLWYVLPATQLRAAFFRVLKRRISSDQGLEPTQLAGFNQFYDDANGTDSWGAGLALDQRLSPTLSAGIEFVGRDLSEPSTNTATGLVEFETRRERGASLYLYWLPRSWLAISAEPTYRRFHRGDQFGELETTELPVSVRFFSGTGIWAGITFSGVSQKGSGFENFDGFFDASQQFCVVNAILGYRLPRRFGTISLQGNNLTNRQFRYQDVVQGVPKYVPESTILLRISLDL
jgi:tetratricopeptide (TPR) repeat protein